jgi:glycine betaine/proline transport system ATP-binding protein
MTDANQQYATVVDDSGKPTGVISMNSLIQAMVTPISHLTSRAAAE